MGNKNRCLLQRRLAQPTTQVFIQTFVIDGCLLVMGVIFFKIDLLSLIQLAMFGKTGKT